MVRLFLIFILLLSSSVSLEAETHVHTQKQQVISEVGLEKTRIITYQYWLDNIANYDPPEWLEPQYRADWKPPLNELTVGAHIYSIHGLNHQLQAFEASVNFWANWKGSLKGWGGYNYENPVEYFGFNSIRSYDLSKVTYEPYITDSGSSVDLQIDGTFSSKFDYKQFPFDNQNLTLELEMGTDAYEFLIKRAGSPTVSQDFNKIMDYQVTEVSLEERTFEYPTTFGVADYADGENFVNTGLSLSIKMERYFLNSFVDFIVPLIIISLLLLINQSRLTTDKGLKLALPPAALLSLIFLKDGTDNVIPHLNYLTFLDYLYLGSFFLVMICFIEATIFKFMDDKSDSALKKCDELRISLIFISWSSFFLVPVFSWFLVSI